MDEREIYKEKARAKLDLLMARIEVLQAQVRDKTADAQFDLNARIDDLQNKRTDLEDRLRKAQNASGDAWAEIKKGLDYAMEDVRRALERAGEALERTPTR